MRYLFQNTGYSVLLLIVLFVNCKTTNKELKLEKIIFHTTGCFGNCNTYHLEIDSNRQTKLFVQEKYKKNADVFTLDFDSSQMGYFKGKISDSSFVKIKKAVEEARIDSLEFPDILCCDGQRITIIAYYNNKRKYLKSMIPPEKSQPLINALFEVCGNNRLPRTTDSFAIEE